MQRGDQIGTVLQTAGCGEHFPKKSVDLLGLPDWWITKIAICLAMLLSVGGWSPKSFFFSRFDWFDG